MPRPPCGATSAGGRLAGGGGFFAFVADLWSLPPQAPKATTAASRAAAIAKRTSDGRDLFVLGDPERRAAAARRDDVRVVDLEAGALQRVDVVDRRAVDVGQALVVDEQTQAAVLEDRIAVALLVEGELILEARAAAAAHADAQAGTGEVQALRVEELADLLGALVGERDALGVVGDLGAHASVNIATATLLIEDAHRRGRQSPH